MNRTHRYKNKKQAHQWMQVGGDASGVYTKGTDAFQEGGFWAPLVGMAGQAASSVG